MHVSVLMVFGITLDPYSIPKSLRFNHPVDLKIGHPARLTELRRTVKGYGEKVHTFDTRGYTVPLLRGYGRCCAHCDRAPAWW